MVVYKLSKPLRFVRYCTGEPEPVYTASATAMQMARKLDALAWKWEVSPYAMAVMPSQELFKDPDGYKRLDAYTCCHSHVNNTHIAQYGVALYRYELPATAYADGVTVSTIKVTISGCPYLKDGARVCVIPSDSGTWRPSQQSHIRNYASYFQGVAKRLTSANGASWLANTETVTATCNSQSTRYLYIALSLESYDTSRNGYIEGAAMLVGDVEITLSTALDGYAEGVDISVAPAGSASAAVRLQHFNTQQAWTPVQYACNRHIATLSTTTVDNLSFVTMSESLGGQEDYSDRASHASPCLDPDYRTLTSDSTGAVNVGIISGPSTSSSELFKHGSARFVYAMQFLPLRGGESYSSLVLGASESTVVGSNAYTDLWLNVYACHDDDASVVNGKQLLGMRASIRGQVYTSMLESGLGSFDTVSELGELIHGMNRRTALVHSPTVRYSVDNFELEYYAVGYSGGIFIPPRKDVYRHVGQLVVPAGSGLTGGSTIPIGLSVPTGTLMTTVLVVASVGEITATSKVSAGLANVQRSVNLACDWSLI